MDLSKIALVLLVPLLILGAFVVGGLHIGRSPVLVILVIILLVVGTICTAAAWTQRKSEHSSRLYATTIYAAMDVWFVLLFVVFLILRLRR